MHLWWIAALTLGASWVELTGGLPPHDDVTTLSYGETPDDIWVGTLDGMVWRSSDGGETYRLMFRPRAAEPIVEPVPLDIDAAYLNDFGRGLDRDLDPRDRRAQARRAADLSGEPPGWQRNENMPLLGSLVREGARDRATITKIDFCFGAVFVLTAETIWRSRDNGVSWDRLFVGPSGSPGELYWMACDETKPGRLLLNTAAGSMESNNWGDAFFPYSNPFPQEDIVDTSTLDSEGRRFILAERMVFREKAGGVGYERICTVVGDSVDANRVHWVWWAGHSGVGWAVTNDGILTCAGGKTRRLRDARFAGRPARFVFVDWVHQGHILVATEHEVYESFDDGETFELVFVTPTQRSIRRVWSHPDRTGDLLVVTGGQIYRRMPDPEHARVSTAKMRHRIDAIFARAPMWEVVQVALERAELSPEQLDAERRAIPYRALLPQVSASYWHHEEGSDNEVDDVLISFARRNHLPDRALRYDRNHAIWTVLAYWDLGPLILDSLQVGRVWADLDRLRARVTYRVQDAYALWARATENLFREDLTAAQRAHHEISRREAAAYLDYMTGGRFEVFGKVYRGFDGALPGVLR